MNVIIISGPSAVGKSQLGKIYADKFGYDFIAKDEIKERFFDSENHNSWDWRWYEEKAKQQFFHYIKSKLTENASLVIESNFIKSDKVRLKQSLEGAENIKEIYVTANGMKRTWRFIKRNESGERHKYHHDRRWYFSEFIDGLAGLFGVRLRYKPVGLNANLLVVDTTKFSEINYEAIDQFLTS